MSTRFVLYLIACFATAAFTKVAVVASPTDQRAHVTDAPATPSDRWQFTLAVPVFMANFDGEIGVRNRISDVDAGFNDVLPQLDMAWTTRAEASRGRFGVLGEVIYLGLSEKGGSNSDVGNVRVEVDQTLADFAVRWRLLESERGHIDVIAGARYTRLYQSLKLQSNDEAIGKVVNDYSQEIGAHLQQSVENSINSDQVFNDAQGSANQKLSASIDRVTGPDARQSRLPHAALALSATDGIEGRVERIYQRYESSLVKASRTDLLVARKAELPKFINIPGRAGGSGIFTPPQRIRIPPNLALAQALRQRINRRVANTQAKIRADVARELAKSLQGDFSRTDDWWDPYIGVRAQYQLSGAFYLAARGDIGGFGIGSDIMWQAEASLGYRLSQHLFAELGYRALSFDYDGNGLTYQTMTHGAQFTIGVQF